MNRYWIPQTGIHKTVITEDLQFYLGPHATVRPYTNQGNDGFLIATPGPCLSDEQIDDICIKSRVLWERQAAARNQFQPDKPLKRPLNQPVVLSIASEPRRDVDRWRSDSGNRYEDRHDEDGRYENRRYEDRRHDDIRQDEGRQDDRHHDERRRDERRRDDRRSDERRRDERRRDERHREME